MERNMEDVIEEVYITFMDGKMFIITPETLMAKFGGRADMVIETTPRAFARILLGDYKLPDGTTYTFNSAWRLGEFRIWGATGTYARALEFVNGLIEDIRKQRGFVTAKQILRFLAG